MYDVLAAGLRAVLEKMTAGLDAEFIMRMPVWSLISGEFFAFLVLTYFTIKNDHSHSFYFMLSS